MEDACYLLDSLRCCNELGMILVHKILHVAIQLLYL